MSTESKYYEYNPEKRNIFIEVHQGRTNLIRDFIMGLFMFFASHASAIVEVFLRKRFGERYITLAQSIGIFIAFIVLYSFADDIYGGVLDSSFTLIFAFIFLGMSIYHRLEIRKYGTTYEFKRFSYSDGEIFPFWKNIIGKKIAGFKITRYHIHVLFEPAIPFFVGFLFMTTNPFTGLIGQIIFLCSIIYGIRNFHKAQQGRNWVLDNIDKKITSEMKYDVFIGRKPKQETKGVYLPIELPEDENVRKALYDIVDDSFETTKNIWENDYLDDKESNGGDISGGFTKDGSGVGNGLANKDGGGSSGGGNG
ncbi:hypothetical protein Q4Q34_08585 [Flavivirga abyssicola]|uniref:hypothetical protein n=1 Tax=Flavivirga abyssicola TaxID=3063533 RepID=UPI0026DEBCEC|nr:hypothetical protein [Flavivirga sp. MEBiC07777]WVK15083.1 hypothetical protein Q4Q34_08585 [Flavivirga sp. MEBiC07777]